MKYYDKKYKNKLISILCDLYKNYANDIHFYDRTENILEILIKIFKNDVQKVKYMKNRIAKLYIKLAKLADGLLGYYYYGIAARKYQEFGEHKKKDKALKMMARINPKDYMAKIEFTPDLSELIEIINIKTNDFIEKKKSMQDITSYIEIPSVHSVINKKKDRVSITDLLQTVIFSPGSSNKLKAENKKIYDFYQVYLNSYLVVKSHFYKSLIEQKIFTIKNLAEYFKKDRLGVDLYLFLLEGMNYFIFNETHAALFILIPQIETLIKIIADKKVGIPIKKLVKEGEQEKTLGDYFSDDKFVEILGLDLNNYCFWFLADKTGLNLRNIITHGLIKYYDVQNHILIGLLEIIFLLILIEIIQK